MGFCDNISLLKWQIPLDISVSLRDLCLVQIKCNKKRGEQFGLIFKGTITSINPLNDFLWNNVSKRWRYCFLMGCPERLKTNGFCDYWRTRHALSVRIWNTDSFFAYCSHSLVLPKSILQKLKILPGNPAPSASSTSCSAAFRPTKSAKHE